MRYITQNATGSIPFGPFVSPTDGVSPISTLVASSFNGIAIANGISSSYVPSTVSYISGGQYFLTPPPSTSLGPLRINFSSPSTFAPVWDDFSVLSSAVYASLFGTSPIAPTDPWLTSLPGSYSGNEAGYVLGAQSKIPIVCTVQPGATTTLITLAVTSGIAPIQPNVLIGRGCLFQSGSSPNGVLVDAYPLITGSTAVAGGTFSITVGSLALPVAPVANDVVWII